MIEFSVGCGLVTEVITYARLGVKEKRCLKFLRAKLSQNMIDLG